MTSPTPPMPGTNGGGGVSYTVKELLSEISAKIDRLNDKFDSRTAELTTRIVAMENRGVLHARMFDDFYTLQKEVQDLREKQVASETVAMHNKWLVGVSLMGIVNLIIQAIEWVMATPAPRLP